MKGQSEPPHEGALDPRVASLARGIEVLVAEMNARQITLQEFDSRLSTLLSQAACAPPDELRTNMERYAMHMSMMAAVELGGTVAEVERRFMAARQLGFADVEQRTHLVVAFVRFAAVLGSAEAVRELLSLRNDLLAVPVSSRARLDRTALRTLRRAIEDLEDLPGLSGERDRR